MHSQKIIHVSRIITFKYLSCRITRKLYIFSDNRHIWRDNHPTLGKIDLYYYSNIPLKCWQCKFPYKSELICSKCMALQKPPTDLNYFDLIGIKEDYNINLSQLQKKYRQLQNLLHPDRYANKTEIEKELSENISSLLNKAYSTLMNPLDRGFYVLKLYDKSGAEKTTNLDPEFLTEVMEKNEEIADAINDETKVMSLLNENRKILADLTEEVSHCFKNKNVEKAKTLLTKMKYYNSMELRLKKLKEDLGITE